MTDTAILAHARACMPEESCGLVVCPAGGENHYFPCRNISRTPTENFCIAPEEHVKAWRSGMVVALVHSHPGGEKFLSAADRRAQRRTGLPWWVVCNGEIYKYRNLPFLTGRLFVHGVADCYTLFRDAYHLAGIDLPDFERGDDWWRRGQNLYLDNLVKNGFRQVRHGIQAGDIILCCYASSVPNHAALYCGDQHILHHIPTQLSKREVYNEQWQRMTHSVWRYRGWQPSCFTGIYNDLVAGTD